MNILSLLAQAEPESYSFAIHKSVWLIHVLGIILWAGGLMFLTRFLGYHARAAKRGTSDEVQAEFNRIEKRLHWLVVVPGLVLTMVGGLWALIKYNPEFMKGGWFHAKLTLVLILLGMHVFTLLKINQLGREPLKGFTPVFSIVHGTAGLILVAILFLIGFQPF